MNNFEEELTCSVCYNIFDDPRILPCSHTFCRNCLENVLNSLESFVWRLSLVRLKCPSCRNITELSQGGVNSLPINFALKSIIEKYKTEEHQTIANCPEHHKQPLNVFCLKDRKLVCGQCLTVGEHQGHPIDDLQSAYIKERETISKLLLALSDKSFTGVSSVIKTIEEQMAHCKSVVQEDKQEVLRFFEKISDILEQKKQSLLATLNEVTHQVTEVYTPQIESMKQIEDEQLDLLSLCSSTKEESSPLVFLENIHNIQQRMRVLKKQKLLSVDHVDITPRVGQVLRNEWLKLTLGEIPTMPIPKINISFDKRSTPETRRINFTFVSMAILFTILCIFLILSYYSPLLSFHTSWWTENFSESTQFLVNSLCSNMNSVKAVSQSITRAVRELIC
ncbi:tripartite motif-containing protein 59 [Pelodytes ibericus]